jgi:type I restriction enzyme S subunit
MKQPKIRFKGFQGEWEETSMGRLSQNFKYGVNSAAVPYDGTNKYLRITDIDENTRVFSQDNITSPGANLSLCNEYLLEDGDITIARTGASVGKSYIYHPTDEKVYFAGFLIRTRLNDNVDSDFVFYNTLTEKYTKYIQLVSQRSGQPGINVNELKGFALNIPYDHKEQKALGSYFQHLDSLIQSTAKKIESLKQIKAASLQSMFPQEGEISPRVRFKGFEGEWGKVLVGKMGTTYSGLSGKTKDDFGIGEARFVTFLNVLTNAIIDTTLLEAVNVFEGEHQNEVRKGDLLFNTSSETPEEVGMCAVMDEDLTNVYLNSFCFGFKVTNENIDSTFIAYLMRSHIGRRIMSILAQGATRYNLSKNSFCKTELLLPKTKAEQQQIANYFTSLDAQITLQTQRLEKLKQIKSACLDNMFV